MWGVPAGFGTRRRLLRLAPAEHVLLLSLHHIISDGWSLGVLIRELTALYQAMLHGRPSPLPELEIQFADYALWQRRWLQGEVLRSQLAYWRRQLAGAPPLLELPTDRPRSLRRGIRGHTRMAHFAPALHAGLKALSAEQRCTPFVTLLAAFAVLLGRVSGQSDVVVGSPIANRRRTEVEGLIGLVLDAFTHQDLPFSRLVEALQPERSVRQRPFFQVLFVLQNAPRHALELPGLRIATLESDEQAEDFDCTLFLEEEPGGELAARMKYSVELFDGTTIRRLLKHLGTLCEGIVTIVQMVPSLLQRGSWRRRRSPSWPPPSTPSGPSRRGSQRPRWCESPAIRSCPCPMPSSGCGSSISSSPEARSTTFPTPCGSTERSRRRCWRGSSTRWCGVTRPCARPLRWRGAGHGR